MDFTYSGKWGVQKEEYNLYYMRDRYYSSELHRFLSLDKDQGDLYRPSTLNPYAYVGNDPINFIDPSGMTAVNIANALKNAVFNEDGSLNWGGLFELGKFALSFSPIDFFIDLYDLGQSILAFDWTGGGLADIGLNVVGFLPGIGNFAKGGGKFIKTADAIADGVDLLSDAGKAITKAGGLFIAGKAAKKLGKTADAAKLAKHVSNGAEAFADSSKAAKALNKGSDAVDATIGNSKNISKNLHKFKEGEDIAHFNKHGNEIMEALGESSYSLEDYINDANYVINNGIYLQKKNAYIAFIGKNSNFPERKAGWIRFGYVGIERNTIDNLEKTITTFHIKHLSELRSEFRDIFNY